MKLYVKNMVCARCVLVVRQIIEQQGFHPSQVQLGEVELQETLGTKQLQALEKKLHEVGFQLIDDRKSRLIEKIKTLLIDLVHNQSEKNLMRVSDYLADQLNQEYNYLSHLFSEIEGITIEKYLIAQKIEKAKELLVYDELSISQIAEQLGYSSVAYLSNQFKKQTGLSPSYYKSLKENKRKSIADL